MARLFNEIDTNNNGKLDLFELEDLMDDIVTATDMSPDDIEALFKKLDTDGSGAIEYSEFITVGMDRALLLSEENMRMAFDSLDTDCTGEITRENLK